MLREVGHASGTGLRAKLVTIPGTGSAYASASDISTTLTGCSVTSVACTEGLGGAKPSSAHEVSSSETFALSSMAVIEVKTDSLDKGGPVAEPSAFSPALLRGLLLEFELVIDISTVTESKADGCAVSGAGDGCF